MSQAFLRFYAQLNDLLPRAQRGRPLVYDFDGTPSVKDAIEALGVLHVEVDLVLGDGEPVDFAWHLHDGARVSVYPAFRSIDLGGVLRLWPPPLREPRFVLDGHLRKLASYLRLLGFDAPCPADASDEELARVSRDDDRTLLTRARGLLRRGSVVRGALVRSTDPNEQLVEVLRRFDLTAQVAPFTRCLRCNTRLEPVSEDEVQDRLPPRVRAHHYRELAACRGCGRVYWPGTHHRRMQEMIERVLSTV